MQLAEFRRSTLWFGIQRVNRDETLWKRRLIDWSHLCSRDPIKGIALCSVCTRLPAGLGMLVVHAYNWLMHVLPASMNSQRTWKFSNCSNIPWLPLWKSASETTLGPQKCWSEIPFGFTQILPEQTHPKNSKNTRHKMEDRNRVTTKEETSLKSPLCIHKKAWKWMNPCEPQSSYISTCEGTSPDLS